MFSCNHKQNKKCLKYWKKYHQILPNHSLSPNTITPLSTNTKISPNTITPLKSHMDTHKHRTSVFLGMLFFKNEYAYEIQFYLKRFYKTLRKQNYFVV